MDPLNSRVLSIIDKSQMSKSVFATFLEVSLPVLTHIGSGRNKPGLELIQKILVKFPEISPDWLLLGAGDMYRKNKQMPDVEQEIKAIEGLEVRLLNQNKRINQVLQYHKILLREVGYLQDLDQLLTANLQEAEQIGKSSHAISQSLKSKLKG